MMRVSIAGADQVDNIWPDFAERFQKACDRFRGDLSSGILWQMCRAGDAMLVVAHDDERAWMASVWRFYTWPSGTVFKCLCLAGERPDLWTNEAREFASNIARAGGATTISANGRSGWKRLFPDAMEVCHVYEVTL